MYNLTDRQKDLLRWLVEQVRDGNLDEQLRVFWVGDAIRILGLKKKAVTEIPKFTKGALEALAAAGLILRDEGGCMASDAFTGILLGKAYEAVDSDFSAPDTSFVQHLTPLADITNLDTELKQRCLPILGAGSADPKLWDSAVRTAGVILEERLHDVGRITDNSRIGRDLVNDVFGQNGTLAAKFANDAERQGYRDLYAGIVGAFRNPYAHRLMDPLPENGGAFIVFTNLLLKMLDNLSKP